MIIIILHLEVCKDAYTITVLTDWKKIYVNKMKSAFVFDGRNILDEDKLENIGFKYYGTGG